MPQIQSTLLCPPGLLKQLVKEERVLICCIVTCFQHKTSFPIQLLGHYYALRLGSHVFWTYERNLLRNIERNFSQDPCHLAFWLRNGGPYLKSNYCMFPPSHFAHYENSPNLLTRRLWIEKFLDFQKSLYNTNTTVTLISYETKG